MARSWDDPKDPDEKIDYGVDWRKPLAGDTITSSSWAVPEGVVKGDDTFNVEGFTYVWLTGGTLGQNYELVNTIHTAAGRIREQTCVLKCRAK